MPNEKRQHRGAIPKPCKGDYGLIRVTAPAHDAAVALALASGRTLTELVSSILINFHEKLDTECDAE